MTASTIQLVGDSLFEDTVRAGMTEVAELSGMLSRQMEEDSAEVFYQRLLQAARSGGGRLLVVDMGGKVQADTFDERCGTRLALAEVHTLLSGEKESDYGFHQCLSPRVRLQCHPEIPVAPGEEPRLLDTSLDEVYRSDYRMAVWWYVLPPAGQPKRRM